MTSLSCHGRDNIQWVNARDVCYRKPGPALSPPMNEIGFARFVGMVILLGILLMIAAGGSAK